MERNALIVFGFLLLFIVILLAKNMYLPDYLQQAKTGSQVVSSLIPTNTQASSANVSFAVVDEILSKKISLSCSLNSGGQKIIAYIKNGSVRASIIDNSSQQDVILKDKKIYFWNKTLSGFINEPTKVSSNPMVASQELKIIDLAKNYQEYCKEENVNDSVFILPKNKSFLNFSSFVN